MYSYSQYHCSAYRQTAHWILDKLPEVTALEIAIAVIEEGPRFVSAIEGIKDQLYPLCEVETINPASIRVSKLNKSIRVTFKCLKLNTKT